MYHMLRLLSARHELHLLTLVPAEAGDTRREHVLASLRGLCHVEAIPAPAHMLGRRLRTLALSALPDMALRGKAPRFAAALASLLAQHNFDVVQAESIEMVQYGHGGVIGGTRAPRTVAGHRPLWCYDAFNAEYLLQRRAFRAALRRIATLPAAVYSLVQWQKLRRYERGLGRGFDMALAVSERDRQTLQRLAGGLPITVVPNGVDTGFFRRVATAAPGPPAAHVPFILFTGTLDFRPNIDAVTWFVRAIWPGIHARRPELRFCVVGQRPGPAVEALAVAPGVVIAGPVEDVRPWFARAEAYVLPMRVGGGVRLKLLETWAMELPCVTTTLGAEGVAGFQAGTHALVADDPQAFAASVARLLDEPALRAGLAAAGRRLVVERYDWRPIVETMERAWIDRFEGGNV